MFIAKYKEMDNCNKTSCFDELSDDIMYLEEKLEDIETMLQGEIKKIHSGIPIEGTSYTKYKDMHNNTADEIHMKTILQQQLVEDIRYYRRLCEY